MNILIIGRGSIGKKHLQTLTGMQKKLAATLHVFEPTGHGAKYYNELAKELESKKIDAAFVCNPTAMHLKTALVCLSAGAHVFLEKPIAAKWDAKAFAQVKALLKKKRLTLMVGYDMRFNPWIQKAKEIVDSGAIGDIWGARVMAGQYLPDWRPNTDYRQSYSAKRALGGGVLLDLSHELDYLHWILPKKITKVSAQLLHTGKLSIETEDVASITFEYADKSTAHVHLDYLTVPYRRSLELYGTKGTLVWDDNLHEIRVYAKAGGAGKKVMVPMAKTAGKEIFKEELTHFFDSIKNRTEPLNSFANAEYVLKMADKALRSAATKKTVPF